MKSLKLALLILASHTVVANAQVVVQLPEELQIKLLNQENFVRPEAVGNMLLHLDKMMGRQRLQQTLSERALKSLEEYSMLDEDQIVANTYVAAAAGGAAIAVVDFLWDRYVGNDKNSKFLVPEDYFDIPKVGIFPSKHQAGRRPFPLHPFGPPPSYSDQIGGLKPHVGYYPVYHGIIEPKNEGGNPVAATPAAVGYAVVGQVAYRAVEYSLKKAFGDEKSVAEMDPRQFDISHLRKGY